MAVPTELTQTEIVVVGEIYVDHIFSGFETWPNPGEEVLARHYHRELGGGAINTACGLARLDRKVRLIGAIGEPDRKFFERRLSEFKLSVNDLVSDAAGTGVTASVSLRDDRSFFTYLGANVLLDELLRTEPAITAMCAARHVHFAMPLSAALAQTLLPVLAEAGCSTSLDVGFNPTWLKDPANRQTCQNIDYFLPNQKEAALAGCGDGSAACMEWAHTWGLPHAVIKLGAAGALVVDASGARLVAAPAIEVCDTTGAGDAFDAGFIDALLAGQSLDDCTRRGCLCGAACCAALGALDGLPDVIQLRSLYEWYR